MKNSLTSTVVTIKFAALWLLLAAGLLLPSLATAGSLTWDSGKGAGGSDGAGSWVTGVATASYWFNGASATTWDNVSDAVIGSGGTPGSISVKSAVTVGNITFNSVGSGAYDVSGACVMTFTGGTVTVNTGAGSVLMKSVQIGGAVGFTKAGTGTLIFTGIGTPTFTGGPLHVAAGTLQLTSSDWNYGAEGLQVDSGATFDISGQNATVDALTGTGTGYVNNSHASSRALIIGSSGGSGEFDGVIESTGAPADLSLTKTGSGTETLGGTSTYTGATTNLTGKLLVNGALAATPVTVASGATFGGTGSVGNALATYLSGALASFTITSSNGTNSTPFTFGGGLTLNTTVVHITMPVDLGASTNVLATYAGALTGTINTTPVIDSGNVASGGGLVGTLSIGSGKIVYTVAVPCPTITLSPAAGALPGGTAGTFYTTTITASGGTGPYSYAVTSGSLPAGLSLSSDGTLSGTPTAAGNPSFTITATDNNGCTGSAAYTLQVVCPTITLSPSSGSPTALTAGTVNAFYSQAFTGSGGTGPYTYGKASGSFPTGLTLTSGTLSGTPTTNGDFSFTIQATDADSCTGTQNYTLHINCPTITLSPSAGALPAGTSGSSYSQAITASGGISPYTYVTNTGSTLPTGVTLSSGGTLSGTPTTSGDFSLTVQATDANGCTGSAAYTLHVNAAAISIFVTLPGETFADGTGNSGTPSYQTAGMPFDITLTAVDTGTNTETSYNTTDTITYSGPGGSPTWQTSVIFTNGVSSVPVTLTKAEVTTITAADIPDGYGGIASSSLTNNPTTLDATYSTITPATASVTVAGSQTITVTARDAYENNLGSAGAGHTVLFSNTGGGSLGSVTDVGNGTYTVSLTAPTTVGSDSVTATLDSVAVGTALGAGGTNSAITYIAGAADGAHSVISASPITIAANGVSTSAITVTEYDVYGNALTASGTLPVLGTDLGTLGSVSNNSNGTYSATLTSGMVAGTAHITGTISGNAIGTPASVAFVITDYKSVASGNWSDYTIWSVSTDGINYVPAVSGQTPTYLDGTVEIVSPNLVTVTANVTVDQVTVDSGATLTVSASQTLTVNDGAGTDLDVSGTLNNSGTITLGAGTPTITFESTSVYNHAENAGTVPTATWADGSTCEITGMTANGPTLNHQSFYDFIWNCTSQTGSGAFGGNDFTEARGNFTVESANGQIFKFTPASGQSIRIGGNFVITGNSTVNILSTGSSTGSEYYFGGNFMVDTGCTLLASGGTDTTLNFTNSSGVQMFTNNGTYSFGSRTINWVVNNNATLYMGTSFVTGAVFTVNSGCTLGIGSAAGITASGATGNVRTTTRNFNTGANYVYNGTGAQVAGNGLPVTVNNLTIANASGVTLSGNVTVNGAFAATYASGTPALVAGSDTVTFNSSLVNITVSGSALSTGNYTIVSSSGTTVSGGLGTLTVSGSGAPYSPSPSVSDGTGQLVLNIASSCTTPGTYTVGGGGSCCSGGPGVSVTLSGSDSSSLVSYQLYNGVTAVGAPQTGTGSGLTWTGVTNAGTYTVKASGDGTVYCTGPVTMSGSAGVTVYASPAITTGPTNETIYNGGEADFTVTATGDSLNYQWRKNGVALTTDSHITNVTLPTLTINPASTNDAALAVTGYDCVISSGVACGSVTSAPVALTVLEPALLTINSSVVNLTFYGTPGSQYDIQRATNLISPSWVTIETTNAPATGEFQFTDDFSDLGGPAYAPILAFYRLHPSP